MITLLAYLVDYDIAITPDLHDKLANYLAARSAFGILGLVVYVLDAAGKAIPFDIGEFVSFLECVVFD